MTSERRTGSGEWIQRVKRTERGGWLKKAKGGATCVCGKLRGRDQVDG